VGRNWTSWKKGEGKKSREVSKDAQETMDYCHEGGPPNKEKKKDGKNAQICAAKRIGKGERRLGHDWARKGRPSAKKKI